MPVPIFASLKIGWSCIEPSSKYFTAGIRMRGDAMQCNAVVAFITSTVCQPARQHAGYGTQGFETCLELLGEKE